MCRLNREAPQRQDEQQFVLCKYICCVRNDRYRTIYCRKRFVKMMIAAEHRGREFWQCALICFRRRGRSSAIVQSCWPLTQIIGQHSEIVLAQEASVSQPSS